MLRTLLVTSAAVAAFSAMAQPCTPDPLYTDSLFGVWPDTTENFAPAYLGVPYQQVLNLKVPQDAGTIDPQFAGVVLDSVAFTGVTGLPPGLSIACASQTPATCSYLTGQLGCGVIQGTPTQLGMFNLTLNVTAYSTLGIFVLPIPYEFSGYRIEVMENTIGISEASSSVLGQVRNVPNPFNARTQIEFQLSKPGVVKVRVFNLVGEELWMHQMQGKAGMNRVPFEGGNLPEGVYLFKVESGKENYTGRMALYR
ncbi:MAG: T9SS type A sorting domain-containing protein [Flavobacteriales bacterium]|nr:T9SS type A sorting domain-containing protein [Flavobacteriales bacterium]